MNSLDYLGSWTQHSGKRWKYLGLHQKCERLHLQGKNWLYKQTLPPGLQMPAKTAWGKSARQDMEPEDWTGWIRSEFCLHLHHLLTQPYTNYSNLSVATWMATAKVRYNVCKISIPKSVCIEWPQQKPVIMRKSGDQHKKILLMTTNH